MKKILAICIGIVSFVSLSLILYAYYSPSSLDDIRNLSQAKQIISPTPIPYVELTIPYLRNKTYDGTLGERSVYQENPNYTSYLTSYTSDKLNINGLLTIPKGNMPQGGWPAIVFVHGYIPPTQYVTTQKYIAYVDTLATNRFVVFKIDLRGHGDSEGTATGAYYSSDYIVDILNARSALASSNFVNANKIGLWGHSMAGNVILRSIAVKPDIPAVVIWAGAVYSYTDMQTYGLNDNSYRPAPQLTQRVGRRNKIFEKYGQYNPSSLFWQQFPAIRFLDEYKGAIEIHHAVDDMVVNIGYSRDLAKILEEKHVTHEVFEYESGSHNIESPSFDTAMQRTVDFYKKHLGD